MVIISRDCNIRSSVPNYTPVSAICQKVKRIGQSLIDLLTTLFYKPFVRLLTNRKITYPLPATVSERFPNLIFSLEEKLTESLKENLRQARTTNGSISTGKLIVEIRGILASENVYGHYLGIYHDKFGEVLKKTLKNDLELAKSDSEKKQVLRAYGVLVRG